VIAAGALLAGGAYAYHEHSESKAQQNSTVRLHIRLHSAKNLLAKDKGDTSDPFVVMKIGHATVKSAIIEKTCNPEWEQEFEVGIIRGKSDELYLEVFDKDKFMDETLGHAKVDLRDLGSDEAEVNLHLKGGGSPNNGKVHLSLWVTGE